MKPWFYIYVTGHTGDATDHVPGLGLATAAGHGLVPKERAAGGVMAVAAPSWQLEVCVYEGGREPQVICKQWAGSRGVLVIIEVHFIWVMVAGIVHCVLC